MIETIPERISKAISGGLSEFPWGTSISWRNFLKYFINFKKKIIRNAWRESESYSIEKLLEKFLKGFLEKSVKKFSLKTPARQETGEILGKVSQLTSEGFVEDFLKRCSCDSVRNMLAFLQRSVQELYRVFFFSEVLPQKMHKK